MASLTNAAEGLASSYVVDAGKSRFVVRASATGLLSAFGHNPTIAIRSFTGEAWFRPQAPEHSSLRLEIDPASLAITGDVNDKDRREMERTMRDEVLEINRFREIRFEGSGVHSSQLGEGIYRLKIAGQLKLHGVERPLELPCNLIAGQDFLRANGEFTIRQTDYGMRLVSVAGGTLKLRDELKFSFDILAHRKPEGGHAPQA
ncbi:MAG TPA: YceI family protein [Bryobacteraceae bacterium]|nr:YceI family protein [Bryobacteraceae bacterium]